MKQVWLPAAKTRGIDVQTNLFSRTDLWYFIDFSCLVFLLMKYLIKFLLSHEAILF